MATPTSVLVSWTVSSGSQPIFYITNHRVDGDTDWIPNPLGTTLATSQSIFGLIGDTTYNVRVQATNQFGVNFSNVVNYTTPHGSVVVRDTASPAEWSSRAVIANSIDVPIEFIAGTAPGIIVTRDIRVNTEWTGPTGVSRDVVFQIEIGATPLAPPFQVQNVQLVSPTNTTMIVNWDDLLTGPRPTGYQVQWRRTGDTIFNNFIPTVPEPNPVGTIVSRTFSVPLEHGGHVTTSRNVDVPSEWRGTLSASRNIDVPIDFGGNFVIARNFTVPVEFRGTTQNVARNAIVPVEFARTFGRNIAPPVEWRLTTPTPTPTGPSPDGTQIGPGGGSIIDNSGNVYNIVLSIANPPGEAYENGAPMPDGGNTSLMEWFGGQVYAQDGSTGNWHIWNGTDFGLPVTPPGGSPTPTPTPTPTGSYIEIDLGDPSTLVDGMGFTWGLDQSDPNGGIATIDGAIDGASAYCDILVYRTDTQEIWIQDQANPGNWYFFTYEVPGNNPSYWSGPFGDPRF